MLTSFRTWHVEAAVMAAILAATVIATGNTLIEWVGAGAVFLSSRHMSIADRMREREEQRLVSEVPCHAWLDRYWVAKEVLWLGYFIALGAWSALVGVGMFLAYPYWRRLYRRWRPIRTG